MKSSHTIIKSQIETGIWENANKEIMSNCSEMLAATEPPSVEIIAQM